MMVIPAPLTALGRISKRGLRPALVRFSAFTICMLFLTANAESLTPNRASDSPQTAGITNQKKPICLDSFPVTSALTGVVSAELECGGDFLWGLRAGTVLLGFKKPVLYLRGSLGVSYPPLPTPGSLSSQNEWQLLQYIHYIYLPEASFNPIESLNKTSNLLLSPAVQQWSIFLDSEVALELLKKAGRNHLNITHWGLKVWQSLPPQWRSLGALRDTRNSSLNGLQAIARFQGQRWRAQAGLGRMTVAIDQVATTFIHPTVELSLALGEAR